MEQEPAKRRYLSKAERWASAMSKFGSRKGFTPVYMKRGSMASKAFFGATRAKARGLQKYNRKQYGYKGRGEYTGQGIVSNNLLIGGAPKVMGFASQYGGSGVTITHKEYLRDLYAPSLVAGAMPDFINIALPINPGQAKTFPWLSQIASNYDEYDLVQLKYDFVSTTSDIGSSTNGVVGTVIMATQYNAEDVPFGDKQTMLQYSSSESCKSTTNMQHFVECDPSKLSGPRGRFVRPGSEQNGDDLNNFDHGIFNVAIANAPAQFANQSLGELHVSYTIQLRKPKMYSQLGLLQDRDLYYQPSPSTDDWLRNSSLAPLYRARSNNIGVSISQASAKTNLITFPQNYSGFVKMTWSASYNSAAGIITTRVLPTVTITAGSNIRLIDDLYYSSENAGQPAPVGGSEYPYSVSVTGGAIGEFSVLCTAVMKVSPASGVLQNSFTINYTSATTPNVPGYASLELVEFNSNFLNKVGNRTEFITDYSTESVTF